MQKNSVFNKFLLPNFFPYGFIPNLKKRFDSKNHRILFQEKESSQLYRSQFLEINYLMAETIKNQFSKTKFS